VFDLREKATHQLVAQQLHELANQFAAGQIDMSVEEWQAPTIIADPIEAVVDLTRRRHQIELSIKMRWPLTGEDSAS